MENLAILPGISPKGKLGLVLGFINGKKPVICGFAEVPKLEVQVPDSLVELVNFKIQERFSMKDWVNQHALQTSKLLVSCVQVIGIYTCSGEQIIESKVNGISVEISEILKRINKNLKNKVLVHYHFDFNGKKQIARVYDFELGSNFVVGKFEEKMIEFIEISCIMNVWLDFEMFEVKNFQEISSEFSKNVMSSIVRFSNIDKSGNLLQSQQAKLYSKSLGKVMEQSEISVRGVLESRVVVPKGSSKDLVSELIKSDLIKSFDTRYSLIKDKFSNIESNFSLPYRVFYRDSILTSDYLCEGETAEDGKQRIESLLGFMPKGVEEKEKPGKTKSIQVPEENRSSSLPFKIILPLCALLLALILGLIIKS